MRFVLAAAVLALAATAPAVHAKRDAPARAATVQTSLTATPKEVHEALRGALSEFKIRIDDPDKQVIKTEWVERQRGDATYRTRIVADYQPDGYQILLAVRCEKQLKQAELRPTLGGPSASWMDVDGDFDIAQAVVRSVEQALGIDEEAVKIGERPATSAKPIEVWDCFVSPSTASRILDLKARRRELVTEVKGLDQKILAAVYDGKEVEVVQSDMDQIRSRKVQLEAQITAIDREILELVLAD